MSISLSEMTETDRNELLKVIRLNGLAKPFFISIDPESTSETTEHLFQMYALLTGDTSILISQALDRYISTLKLEEA